MMTKEERDAVVEYRIEKAHNTLGEIPFLIEKDMLSTAVNRLYYSCFYAAYALLISRKIVTKTHNGVIRMLALHFTKTEKLSLELNDFYIELFDHRNSSDYADFIYFDKETVEELYKQAIVFVDTIEKLIEK